MMLSRLKKIQLISLVLAALMLWQYGGGRTYAALSQVQLQPSLCPEGDSRLANGLAESRFDELLAELKQVIRDDGAKTKAAPDKGFAGIERLNAIKDKLAAEDEKNQQYFAQLEQTIAEKKLPAEIRERHAEFVRQYQSKYDALIAHLRGLESAHQMATGLLGKLTGQSQSVNWGQVIEQTASFLDANTPQPRPRQSLDPRNLPHRSLKAERAIAPKLTRAEWLKAFPKEADPAGPTSGPTSDKRSGAKTGDTLSPLATSPPTPADLAETIEVKFTPEIRQLADSLDRNPVKIYNWVRNNIEFAPVWGSIQGAQLCLETKSCNAFDTASLLISLLRISGIPSRYQMGTIEVPIEKFKNWAGGFTNAEAAASLFASGGTPSVVRRVNQIGQVVTVRLEHVWAKAFVDYAPSGGAVNLRGNTWIEVDPSFKQYAFFEGVDFEAVTPSNTQAVLNQLVSNATVDPATNSITNLNSATLQTHIQTTTAQRVSYLQTNLPNATLYEAFGGRAIRSQALTIMPATVPYRVLARAGEQSQIPDGLRHRVTFDVGSNAQTPDAADQFSYTASLPELAGQNVLLTYAPATPADEGLIAAAQGLFPAFITLVPQLYVGSQRVATGRALAMGRTVVSRVTFTAPTLSLPSFTNNLLAGEAAAIGLDLQGVSLAQMEELRRKTESVRSRLQQGQPEVTGPEFAEAFLASNIMNWFAVVDLNNRMTSQSAGLVTIRYPSAGLFAVKLNAASVFGVVSSVSLGGLSMDIDRDVVVSVDRGGDETRTARINFAQGAFGSAMEAEIPSRGLSTPQQPVLGIATPQALRLANNQGIPIYTITQANAATVLPLLQIHPDDLADIRDAINAGQEVIVSRTPVNFNGQSVLGIVVKDPLTGSALFLISGGTNGAIIAFFTSIAITLIFAGFLLGPIGFVVGAVLAALILLLAAISLALANAREGQEVLDTTVRVLFSLGFAILVAIFAVFLFPALAPVLIPFLLAVLGGVYLGALLAEFFPSAMNVNRAPTMSARATRRKPPGWSVTARNLSLTEAMVSAGEFKNDES